MNIRQNLEALDQKVLKGDLVNAVQDHFADNVVTADYDKSATGNKAEMVSKLTGFVEQIAKVNEITLHNTVLDGNISDSQFTFDLDMKDGSKYYHNEIVRREWNDQGQVTSETYWES